MSGQTQITIRREDGTKGYADRLRAYKIKVDGVLVGSVRLRDSFTIPISPGRHSLVIRIDWCGSQQIEFEAKPGEHISFECGCSVTGRRSALIHIIFRTHDYLWLRRTA
ncbi:MAG: hypothetical protein JWR26_169 [Pedosphaera sp.]|nr:hypothetical protein [Pedosphaera sp.]